MRSPVHTDKGCGEGQSAAAYPLDVLERAVRVTLGELEFRAQQLPKKLR